MLVRPAVLASAYVSHLNHAFAVSTPFWFMMCVLSQNALSLKVFFALLTSGIIKMQSAFQKISKQLKIQKARNASFSTNIL